MLKQFDKAIGTNEKWKKKQQQQPNLTRDNSLYIVNSSSWIPKIKRNINSTSNSILSGKSLAVVSNEFVCCCCVWHRFLFIQYVLVSRKSSLVSPHIIYAQHRKSLILHRPRNLHSRHTDDCRYHSNGLPIACFRAETEKINRDIWNRCVWFLSVKK